MARPPVKSEKDEAAAYDAAQKVVEIHRRLTGFMAIGHTLAHIDAFVGKALQDLQSKSCFFKYRPGRMPPFPSQSCLSLNDCVVHGTAGYYTDPIKPGDVLSVDVGVAHKGWIGDAAWTYVFGEKTAQVAKLCECGQVCLRKGIEQLKPDRPLLEWAKAVQSCVEEDYGYHLIRGLGGHGYGRSLHAPPFVSNVVPSFPGEWPDASTLPLPGTLIAVEPMIAIGTGQTHQEHGTWPIYSADRSLSVHYEHDVLITESGNRVLTEGLDDLDDLITREL